ncbi:MAG: DUF1232 domain-containing protein [Muribaculaceae bacterium]|nr:DUF1232 domain-containing protein [Muribaculaceae bacterium]
MDKSIFENAVRFFKEKLDNYKDKYNPNALFEKIKTSAKKAGANVVYYVLILYYALTKGSIPLKERILVIAALGYFISPFDFIPDFVLAGLLDDMSVLAFVVSRVSSYIDEDVKQQANAKLKEWFGDDEIKNIKTDVKEIEKDLYKLIDNSALSKSDKKTDKTELEATSKSANSYTVADYDASQNNKNMYLYLPFQQISLYSKLNNDINIEFTHISDKELRVTWIQHNIIKDIRLGLKLKIEEVKSDYIIFSYEGGLAKMIISPLLSYLANRIPEIKDSIKKEESNRISVNLANIEKLEPLLDKIELKNILVENSGIKLMANFRIPLSPGLK